MTRGREAPLRVALLHAFDWSEVRRGTERLVRELAAGLAGAGHDVTVITAHRGARRVEDRDGVRVVLNPRPPAGGPVRRHALAHIPKAWASLRSGDFDVAHAFHPSDVIAALGWRRSAGGPVIFTVPAFPPDDAGPLRRRMLQRVFAGAASVVVPTQAVEDEVRAAFPAAVVDVIPPGVDVERFRPGDGRAERPTAFCAADLAEPRKRVEDLVRAFGDVRGSRPVARLVLANPHPERTVPAWARAPGVEVRPIRGDGELAAAYREAWVSVLPAAREPFGLVLAESMACGTPVIGADADGIPEVIGAGPQGRVVAPSDRAAWVAALAEALGSPPPPEVSAAARERATQLSMTRCVADYEALYRRLIEASEGPRG